MQHEMHLKTAKLDLQNKINKSRPIVIIVNSKSRTTFSFAVVGGYLIGVETGETRVYGGS